MSVRFAAAFGSPGADYTELAASSRDSGARAVLVCGHLRESMAMRRALAGLGWTPGVYYATVGPVLDEYQEELGPLAQGTFSSTQWQYHQKQAFPGVHEFHDSFVGKWGEAPSYHAASAYAAGQILEAAAQKTGSLKHDDLARMLSTMDLTTVIGRWGVDPDGMQIRHFALVLQWQDGRKEVVWPRALATAKPRLGP
jgi:branched-chain amino acid transport system substrate-binding protein